MEEMEKDVITEQLEVNQKTITKDDICKPVRPADVPYYKYMEVVQENEDLKEIIVKLVKRLNRRNLL